MKSVVAVVVDSGADFQLEGEATVNPSTQSPYTLHTESGPDWFFKTKSNSNWHNTHKERPGR